MDNKEIVEKYLSRINYDGGREPNAENLALLQYSHLLSVPYENLDILAGQRIKLDIESLADKIINRSRGGYCFELNRLFGWLLSELGYGVTDYVARYFRGESATPKRRHHVLRVKCPDNAEFLCDVGVGAVIPLYPIPYRFDSVFDQDGVRYALKRDDVFGVVLTEPHDGGWRWVYSFEELPQHEVDFIFASYWCEFAQESPFNKKYILSVRKPGKRFTIDGFTLREFSAPAEKSAAVGSGADSGTVQEKSLTQKERSEVLRGIFGIYTESAPRI